MIELSVEEIQKLYKKYVSQQIDMFEKKQLQKVAKKLICCEPQLVQYFENFQHFDQTFLPFVYQGLSNGNREFLIAQSLQEGHVMLT